MELFMCIKQHFQRCIQRCKDADNIFNMFKTYSSNDNETLLVSPFSLRPSFTLFSYVGWLKFSDGKNVDKKFRGIRNGVTASEENLILLGIFPGIFSIRISMVVII